MGKVTRDRRVTGRMIHGVHARPRPPRPFMKNVKTRRSLEEAVEGAARLRRSTHFADDVSHPDVCGQLKE